MILIQFSHSVMATDLIQSDLLVGSEDKHLGNLDMFSYCWRP